ncbi:MAG: FAD-dependent oxidoreductase [Planctomycetota bacterium]
MNSDILNLDRHWQLIVVGGGLAGLSCAASCAKQGIGPILLLEAENLPGAHSSGRNAGLVRNCAEDPWITRLCIEGARFIEQNLGGDERNARFHRTGSLIFDQGQAVSADSWQQVPHQDWSRQQFLDTYPEFGSAPTGTPRYVASDGVVEVPALLAVFAQQAIAGGVEICCGVTAERPIASDGCFQGLRIAGIDVSAEAVVVANGAWAGQWSESVGLPIDLQPFLRSCLTTEALSGSRMLRPWLWNHDHGWYLRPGVDETLWSGCEEIEDQPGRAQPQGDPWGGLQNKIEDLIPQIHNHSLRRIWAGHRSFCPDRRFLLGPDPRLSGWHWAVGLGGHGVTAAHAVGERVAHGISSGSDALEAPFLWSEERFSLTSAGTT